MDMAAVNREHEVNLADLWVGSVERIALLTGCVGYGALIVLAWPTTRSAGVGVWLGPLLLVACAGAALALRQRYRLAASLLIVGALAAVLSALLSLGESDVAYLFIMPVLFASVLLQQRETLLVAAVSTALTLGAAQWVFGLPVTSLAAALPAMVLALCALTSWQGANNLYVALEWVWNGFAQAHRNEQIARDQQGRLRQAVKALDEATYRLERANHMLSTARDRAEEAQRLKQQFVQTVSHELRTPLNVIVGFAELLADSPEYYGQELAPAYVRDLSVVRRNARHLQSLVNDVLDLARIDAAQMTLVREEADPGAMAEDAANTVRSLVEARGLVLKTAVEPDLPRLLVDPTRIRQVLVNLLNNAARFTEHGEVSLTVRRQQKDVVFTVADTGVGIAPADIPRIFEEFRQVDGTRRRRHEGAGLGLAISKRFVDLHGGRIWVESQVGRGSAFSFSLPVAAQRALPETGGSVAQPEGRGTMATREGGILLAVTDSPAAAAMVCRYVRGHRTVVVPDLVQARQAAVQLMPQGVIIDNSRQSLDPGALLNLAKSWALPRSPFIACPLPREGVLTDQPHADGYLVKPVSRRSLWDLLRQLGEDVERILVIDDDRDFVRLMARMLESPVRSYEVATAFSAGEGLEMLRRELPHLVFLDLTLPDMDGLKVIEHIRADPLWRHLPVVIVSAKDEFDAASALPGTMLITRASGLLPKEIVQWTQQVLDTCAGISPHVTDPSMPASP